MNNKAHFGEILSIKIYNFQNNDLYKYTVAIISEDESGQKIKETKAFDTIKGLAYYMGELAPIIVDEVIDKDVRPVDSLYYG